MGADGLAAVTGIDRSITSEGVDLARLIAERVLVLHAPEAADRDAGLGGRDIDCAVEGLDPIWPLRLPPDWRLCACIHYDLKGWYWVVERAGAVIAFDTIDDPLGLGRDALPTSAIVANAAGQAPPAVRAAYLSVKRLRKGIRSNAEWLRIGRLAKDDPSAFQKIVAHALGESLSSSVFVSALNGQPPQTADFDRAQVTMRLRRFGSPKRVATALTIGMQRYAGRILHPSGMVVTVNGPDGSGKSSLARMIAPACGGIFKRSAVLHWRPGLLPGIGEMLGTAPRDPDSPHGSPPHPRWLSILVLGYYWLDFLVGGLARISPLRIRAGIVIVERGWWDIAVDPGRYRLDVPEWTVRWLGWLLPKSDLILTLEAPPEVMLARKNELPGQELVRQMRASRTVSPPRVPHTFLDASQPSERVVADAREVILRHVEARSIGRLGAGWAALPTARKPRWWIPRGPGRVALAGLLVDQPNTTHGRVLWRAARTFAAAGGMTALPRGSAPPRGVREKLAPFLPPRSTFAVAAANHPGRYVATIIGRSGDAIAFAKVALTGEGAGALEHEAAALRSYGRRLTRPLTAPVVRAEEPGLLLFDAVRWRLTRQPWVLREEVAAALGRLFRGDRPVDRSSVRGVSHGDVAPWNLLHTPNGTVLVDWESASDDRPAFFDFWHFVIQAHTLLGRPRWEELYRGLLDGAGWVGRGLDAYAAEAGVAREEARGGLIAYLQISSESLGATSARERSAVLARRRMLGQLSRER